MKKKIILLLIGIIIQNNLMVFAQDSFYFGQTKIKKSYLALDSSMYFIGEYGTTSSLSKVKNNVIEYNEYFGNDYEISDILVISNSPIILNRSTENGVHKNLISKLNLDGSIEWTIAHESTQQINGYFSNNSGIINGNQVFAYVTVNNKYNIHVFNSSGNLIWCKGLDPKGGIPKMAFDGNGNLIISYSKNGDLFIAKFDIEGNLLWHDEHVFVFNDKIEFKNLIILPNNAIISFGMTPNNTYSKLLYLNQNGNYQFGRQISGGLVYQLAEIKSATIIDSNIFITFKQGPQHLALPKPENSGIIKLDLSLNLINQLIFEDTLLNYCLSSNQNSLLLSYDDHYKIMSKNLLSICDTVNNPAWVGGYQYLLWSNSLNQISSINNNFFASSLTKTNFSEDLHLGCLNLAVNNFKNNISFSIFPNPLSNNFTIYYEGESQKLNYSVHDILGKKIISGQLNSSQTQIDCANWSKGIYLIKIFNEEGYSVKKIVVE